MKNWITIEHGSWINATTWESLGQISFDPEAVSCIEDYEYISEGCSIYLGYSGRCITCKFSRNQMLAQIQSATSMTTKTKANKALFDKWQLLAEHIKLQSAILQNDIELEGSEILNYKACSLSLMSDLESLIEETVDYLWRHK
jgi:hypothetical protein